MGHNTIKYNKKIYKLYMKQIISYFPIITKKEKSYIKSYNILDFYPTDRKISIEELYEAYGYPKDIFSAYLSSVDPETLYKQIKKTSIVKKLSITILIILFILLAACLRKAYCNYKEYQQQIEISNGYWVDTIE